MYCGCIPLACNSGGPTESIADKQTGFLLDGDNPQQWAKKLYEIFSNLDTLKSLKSKAKQRVEDVFSFKAFRN